MKHDFTTATALALGTVAALADGHLSGDIVTAMSFNATAQRGNAFVRDTPGS